MTQVHTNTGLDPTRTDFYRHLLREHPYLLLMHRFYYCLNAEQN